MRIYDPSVSGTFQEVRQIMKESLTLKKYPPEESIFMSIQEQEKYYYSWTGGGKNKKIIDIRELTDTSAVKLNNYLISHNLYSGTLFAHYLQRKAGKLVRIMEYDELPF